jgi:hypothetical protein
VEEEQQQQFFGGLAAAMRVLDLCVDAYGGQVDTYKDFPVSSYPAQSPATMCGSQTAAGQRFMTTLACGSLVAIRGKHSCSLGRQTRHEENFKHREASTAKIAS